MKSALFVDFDNVYSGLRKLDPVIAERFARQPNLSEHVLPLCRRGGRTGLHAPPVLSAHLEQRARDLSQRAHPHRFHQHLEHVAVLDHRLLKPLQHGG